MVAWGWTTCVPAASADSERGALPPEAAASATIRSADQATMKKTLSRCFQVLPTPAREFKRDRESEWTEIGLPAGADAAPGASSPAEASSARVYEGKATGDSEDVPVLEVRVYINLERGLPEPLGSEGGVLQTFTHDGLPGMRVSLAGVDPGRVALPLTPAETENALIVARLHVGAAEIEPYLVDIAQGRRPTRSPWAQKAAERASEVRTIVVEYRGPRREVERLVRATTASKLRAILTPTS